jgi:hypothetical protein
MVSFGGTPQSAARAGHLDLPVTLCLISGAARHAIDIYRAAGEQAGHAEN